MRPLKPCFNGLPTRGTTEACRSITISEASSATRPTLPNRFVMRRCFSFSQKMSKVQPTLAIAEAPNSAGRTLRDSCQSGTAVLATSTPV